MSQERDDAIAPELRRLELMLLDPDVRRDSRQVEKLLAEDFLEFGSSGRIWTRDATLASLATEDYIPPAIEEFACRVLAADVVHATYRSVRRSTDGEAESEVLRSSIWVRKDGEWKMIFHQGTRTDRG